VAEAGGDFGRHFSGFGGKAYLDCAAMGPFPLETSEAVRQALRFKEHPEELSPEIFETLPDKARSAAARLIGCSPSSITLGTGASHGLNAAALGLPLRRGDEVLIPAGEFPAVVLPFVYLEPAGITLRRVPAKSGRIVEAGDVVRAIGPKTRLVAVSLVTFNTGYRIDVAALGEACRGPGRLSARRSSSSACATT
jgi:selenocysteine lyase/cysteine desulfurase